MIRTLILATAGLALTACATGPAYKPATKSNTSGYSETAIESNRFMVSFKGNSQTERQEVETFLLFRAAELTLEQGYDHFIVLDRDTESKSKLRADHFGGHHSRWGFHYAYFHPRHGWYGAYDPFWRDSPDYTEVTRYEASAEIVMREGKKDAEDARAFDARDVVANLRDDVYMPE